MILKLIGLILLIIIVGYVYNNFIDRGNDEE